MRLPPQVLPGRFPVAAGGVAAIVAVLLTVAPARATDYPLATSKIALEVAKPGKQRLAYRGRWAGTLDGTGPVFDGATVQVTGGPGEAAPR